MLCMDAQHTKHVTSTLASHFVWDPNYRKKILVGKLAPCVEQEIRRICETTIWMRGALNVQANHMHLFRESLPHLLLPRRLLTRSKARPPASCCSVFLKERNSFGAVPSGLVRTTWVESEIGAWIP